jgi:hypothetical protein
LALMNANVTCSSSSSSTEEIGLAGYKKDSRD